jgi:hypothetical protein
VAVLIAVLASFGAQLCDHAISAEATTVHEHRGTPAAGEHHAPGNHDDHSCGPTGTDVPVVQPAPVPGPDLVIDVVEQRSALIDPGAALPRVDGGDVVRAPPRTPSLVLICVSRR